MTDTPDSSEDFAALLAEFEAGGGAAPGQEGPDTGDKVSGTILSIGDDVAFVDLGAKAEGMLALAELRDPDEPEDSGILVAGIGDRVEAIVTGVDQDSGCLRLRMRPGKGSEMDLAELHQAQEHGIPLEGMVQSVVKGGLEVTVAGVRAFCPVSQIDTRYVEEPSVYVGQRLSFLVTQLEEGRGRPNLVVSRRALLEREQAAAAEEVRKSLDLGVILDGTVTSVTGYGAFVELGGGIEGLLHVSEMAHGRVEDPTQLYEPGQRVEVEIVSIQEKDGKERIGLSRKSLLRDPWRDVEDRFPRGTIHSGHVQKVESFGAFVELAPGVQGLLHVSEMGAEKRIDHAREVVELGQSLEVEILRVEPEKRRISLRRAAAVDQDVETAVREARAKREESAGSGFATLGDQLKGLVRED